MRDAWIDRLEEVIRADGRSMRAISIAAGVGPNFLQQAIKNEKDPGFSKLSKVLAELGSGATLYVISGISIGDDEAELLRLMLDLSPRVRREALDLFRAIASR